MNRPCNHLHPHKWLRRLVLAGPLLVLAGCGYQQGHLYRQDIQTVAVPVFANKSFNRDVEVGLTKAVISRLEAHSPYKVVPRDRADAILEGEITAADLKTWGRDYDTNIPREQALTLTVDFTLKDMKTGRILRQRRDFTQTALYYPTLGEGEFVGSQQALEKLALAIVQELQADW